MHLQTGPFMASLLVSAVGVVLFYYGRKMTRFPHLLVGIAMLVYPYFTGSVLVMALVAVGLLAALGLAVRLGW